VTPPPGTPPPGTSPPGRPPASGLDDIEDIDPGLAGERTELAWTRTAVSFAAAGAVLLKYQPAAGVPILVLAAVVWELRRLPRAPGSGRRHDRRLLAITVATAGIAVTALLISFLVPGSPGLHLAAAFDGSGTG
jgi:uncharacterized membrane protein YidH (DUF202 family)